MWHLFGEVTQIDFGLKKNPFLTSIVPSFLVHDLFCDRSSSEFRDCHIESLTNLELSVRQIARGYDFNQR